MLSLWKLDKHGERWWYLQYEQVYLGRRVNVYSIISREQSAHVIAYGKDLKEDAIQKGRQHLQYLILSSRQDPLSNSETTASLEVNKYFRIIYKV